MSVFMQRDGSITTAATDSRPVRATTPAEAARVLLDGIPNPIFDALKPVLIGEHHVSLPALDDDGREHVRKVNVPWVVQKQIIAAALRAIADGGDDE